MADLPPSLRPQQTGSGSGSSRTVSRCLMLQTEHPQLVRAAVEKLRKSDMHPGCKVLLVCRKEDLESFRDLPDVECLTYSRSRGDRFSGLWRRMSGFRADLVCAVFGGRPVFRLQKLLFFLAPGRSRLIFDARAQPYSLRLGNIAAIRRRSRYEEVFPAAEATILYLPTESDSIALEVLERLQDRKIIGPGRILVFCSEAKRDLYESRPEVSEVIAYGFGQKLRKLRMVLRLARMRADVVVAILSGRPIFRAHKRLFLLLPARARLVFNEHGDCHYVKRNLRGLLGLWRAGSFAKIDPYRRLSRRGLRYRAPLLVKAVLFFPRYLYLVLWLLLGCLKKGGSKRLTVFRQENFGARE